MTTAARAMETAIRRREWERIALALLLACAEAARRAPPGEIEDLLRLLDGDETENQEPGNKNQLL